MSRLMIYTLPIPPSINAKFINRTFIVSKEYRNYKNQVKLLYPSEKLLSGNLYLSAHFLFKDNRRDIDSGLKSLLDAMQSVFFENDKQICFLVLSKKVDKENPRVEIEFRLME